MSGGDETIVQRESFVANANPISAQTPAMPCLICGGDTVLRFSKAYRGRDVPYFRCLACNHLTAGEIESNASAYGEAYFEHLDVGWQDRNRRILQFIRWIGRLPGIGFAVGDSVLDFGCGVGRLVADLNRSGFNAYGFEPYGEPPLLPERIFSRWSDARASVNRVSVVTCVEVLEHLRDPDTVLGDIAELLVPSGYVLLSTEMYEEGVHDQDWYYLNPAAGHVSIFTERSLLCLLSRSHFEPVLRISGNVWLFRKILGRTRNVLERGYFGASQSRVKWRMRRHHDDERTAKRSR
jgi:SAM-dependent methyltransferase